MIYRVAVVKKGEEGGVYRIYNLETPGEIDVSCLDWLFCTHTVKYVMDERNV